MFILSGCAVVEGDARYMVTAVGKYSEWGKIMTELDTDRPDTPLQVGLPACPPPPPFPHHFKVRDHIYLPAPTHPLRVQIKLAGVAETVGKFGLAVAVACFVAQVIIWLSGMSKKVRHPAIS